MEQEFRGLGRCTCCFWAAVAFDLLGLSVLLVGVFAPVFFFDLLIYAGAIVIFLSLIWWVFWYSGNIEVPPADLEEDAGWMKKRKGGLAGVGGAVRRLSSRLRSSFRGKGSEGDPEPRSAGGVRNPPLHHHHHHQKDQVVVAMAAMGQHQVSSQSVSSAGGAEVQMPPTSTETSPT